MDAYRDAYRYETEEEYVIDGAGRLIFVGELCSVDGRPVPPRDA